MIDSRKTSKVQKVEGTMYFYAPEMCKDDADSEFEAFPLDIWAMGVTLYCLVYLRLPFTSPNNDYFALIDKISYTQVEFPKDREVSEDLKDLIKQLLEKEPSKRITIEQIKKNSWLNKGKEKFNET
jgi:serine/threonine protein kinase